MAMMHLRKLDAPSRRGCAVKICFSTRTTQIGRIKSLNHYVICSSDSQNNSIISRRHSRVKLHENGSCEIFDDSRNGIFVNDVKINGSAFLEEGDIVTFGHLHGERIDHGTRFRQPESEFIYIFEPCHCNAGTENIPINILASSSMASRAPGRVTHCGSPTPLGRLPTTGRTDVSPSPVLGSPHLNPMRLQAAHSPETIGRNPSRTPSPSPRKSSVIGSPYQRSTLIPLQTYSTATVCQNSGIVGTPVQDQPQDLSARSTAAGQTQEAEAALDLSVKKDPQVHRTRPVASDDTKHTVDTVPDSVPMIQAASKAKENEVDPSQGFVVDDENSAENKESSQLLSVDVIADKVDDDGLPAEDSEQGDTEADVISDIQAPVDMRSLGMEDVPKQCLATAENPGEKLPEGEPEMSETVDCKYRSEDIKDLPDRVVPKPSQYNAAISADEEETNNNPKCIEVMKSATEDTSSVKTNQPATKSGEYNITGDNQHISEAVNIIKPITAETHEKMSAKCDIEENNLPEPVYQLGVKLYDEAPSNHEFGETSEDENKSIIMQNPLEGTETEDIQNEVPKCHQSIAAESYIDYKCIAEESPQCAEDSSEDTPAALISSEAEMFSGMTGEGNANQTTNAGFVQSDMDYENFTILTATVVEEEVAREYVEEIHSLCAEIALAVTETFSLTSPSQVQSSQTDVIEPQSNATLLHTVSEPARSTLPVLGNEFVPQVTAQYSTPLAVSSSVGKSSPVAQKPLLNIASHTSLTGYKRPWSSLDQMHGPLYGNTKRYKAGTISPAVIPTKLPCIMEEGQFSDASETDEEDVDGDQNSKEGQEELARGLVRSDTKGVGTHQEVQKDKPEESSRNVELIKPEKENNEKLGNFNQMADEVDIEITHRQLAPESTEDQSQLSLSRKRNISNTNEEQCSKRQKSASLGPGLCIDPVDITEPQSNTKDLDAEMTETVVCIDPVDIPENSAGGKESEAKRMDTVVCIDPVDIPENSAGSEESEAEVTDTVVCTDPVDIPEHSAGVEESEAEVTDTVVCIDPDDIPENSAGSEETKAERTDTVVCTDPVVIPENSAGSEESEAEVMDTVVCIDPVDIPENSAGSEESEEEVTGIVVCTDPVDIPDNSAGSEELVAEVTDSVVCTDPVVIPENSAISEESEAEVTDTVVCTDPVDILENSAGSEKSEAEVTDTVVCMDPVDIPENSAGSEESEVTDTVVCTDPVVIPENSAGSEESEAEVTDTVVCMDPVDIPENSAGSEDSEVTDTVVCTDPVDILENSTGSEESEAEVTDTVVCIDPVDIPENSAGSEESEAEVTDTVVCIDPVNIPENSAGSEESEAEVTDTVVCIDPVDIPENSAGSEESEAEVTDTVVCTDPVNIPENSAGSEESEAEVTDTVVCIDPVDIPENSAGSEESEAEVTDTVVCMDPVNIPENSAGSEESEVTDTVVCTDPVVIPENSAGSEESEAEVTDTVVCNDPVDIPENSAGSEESEAEVTDTVVCTDPVNFPENSAGSEESEAEVMDTVVCIDPVDIPENSAGSEESEAEVTDTVVCIDPVDIPENSAGSEESEVTDTVVCIDPVVIPENSAGSEESEAEVSDTVVCTDPVNIPENSAGSEESEAEVTDTVVCTDPVNIPENSAGSEESEAEVMDTVVCIDPVDIPENSAGSEESEAEVTESEAEVTDSVVCIDPVVIPENSAVSEESEEEVTDTVVCIDPDDIPENSAGSEKTKAEMTDTVVCTDPDDTTQLSARSEEAASEMTETVVCIDPVDNRENSACSEESETVMTYITDCVQPLQGKVTEDFGKTPEQELPADTSPIRFSKEVDGIICGPHQIDMDCIKQTPEYEPPDIIDNLPITSAFMLSAEEKYDKMDNDRAGVDHNTLLSEKMISRKRYLSSSDDENISKRQKPLPLVSKQDDSTQFSVSLDTHLTQDQAIVIEPDGATQEINREEKLASSPDQQSNNEETIVISDQSASPVEKPETIDHMEISKDRESVSNGMFVINVPMDDSIEEKTEDGGQVLALMTEMVETVCTDRKCAYPGDLVREDGDCVEDTSGLVVKKADLRSISKDEPGTSMDPLQASLEEEQIVSQLPMSEEIETVYNFQASGSDTEKHDSSSSFVIAQEEEKVNVEEASSSVHVMQEEDPEPIDHKQSLEACKPENACQVTVLQSGPCLDDSTEVNSQLGRSEVTSQLQSPEVTGQLEDLVPGQQVKMPIYSGVLPDSADCSSSFGDKLDVAEENANTMCQTSHVEEDKTEFLSVLDLSAVNKDGKWNTALVNVENMENENDGDVVLISGGETKTMACEQNTAFVNTACLGQSPPAGDISDLEGISHQNHFGEDIRNSDLSEDWGPSLSQTSQESLHLYLDSTQHCSSASSDEEIDDSPLAVPLPQSQEGKPSAATVDYFEDPFNNETLHTTVIENPDPLTENTEVNEEVDVGQSIIRANISTDIPLDSEDPLKTSAAEFHVQTEEESSSESERAIEVNNINLLDAVTSSPIEPPNTPESAMSGDENTDNNVTALEGKPKQDVILDYSLPIESLQRAPSSINSHTNSTNETSTEQAEDSAMSVDIDTTKMPEEYSTSEEIADKIVEGLMEGTGSQEETDMDVLLPEQTKICKSETVAAVVSDLSDSESIGQSIGHDTTSDQNDGRTSFSSSELDMMMSQPIPLVGLPTVRKVTLMAEDFDTDIVPDSQESGSDEESETEESQLEKTKLNTSDSAYNRSTSDPDVCTHLQIQNVHSESSFSEEYPAVRLTDLSDSDSLTADRVSDKTLTAPPEVFQGCVTKSDSPYSSSDESSSDSELHRTIQSHIQKLDTESSTASEDNDTSVCLAPEDYTDSDSLAAAVSGEDNEALDQVFKDCVPNPFTADTSQVREKVVVTDVQHSSPSSEESGSLVLTQNPSSRYTEVHLSPDKYQQNLKDQKPQINNQPENSNTNMDYSKIESTCLAAPCQPDCSTDTDPSTPSHEVQLSSSSIPDTAMSTNREGDQEELDKYSEDDDASTFVADDESFTLDNETESQSDDEDFATILNASNSQQNTDEYFSDGYASTAVYSQSQSEDDVHESYDKPSSDLAQAMGRFNTDRHTVVTAFEKSHGNGKSDNLEEDPSSLGSAEVCGADARLNSPETHGPSIAEQDSQSQNNENCQSASTQQAPDVTDTEMMDSTTCPKVNDINTSAEDCMYEVDTNHTGANSVHSQSDDTVLMDSSQNSSHSLVPCTTKVIDITTTDESACSAVNQDKLCEDGETDFKIEEACGEPVLPVVDMNADEGMATRSLHREYVDAPLSSEKNGFNVYLEEASDLDAMAHEKDIEKDNSWPNVEEANDFVRAVHSKEASGEESANCQEDSYENKTCGIQDTVEGTVAPLEKISTCTSVNAEKLIDVEDSNTVMEAKDSSNLFCVEEASDVIGSIHGKGYGLAHADYEQGTDMECSESSTNPVKENVTSDYSSSVGDGCVSANIELTDEAATTASVDDGHEPCKLQDNDMKNSLPEATVDIDSADIEEVNENASDQDVENLADDGATTNHAPPDCDNKDPSGHLVKSNIETAPSYLGDRDTDRDQPMEEQLEDSHPKDSNNCVNGEQPASDKTTIQVVEAMENNLISHVNSNAEEDTWHENRLSEMVRSDMEVASGDNLLAHREQSRDQQSRVMMTDKGIQMEMEQASGQNTGITAAQDVTTYTANNGPERRQMPCVDKTTNVERMSSGCLLLVEETSSHSSSTADANSKPDIDKAFEEERFSAENNEDDPAIICETSITIDANVSVTSQLEDNGNYNTQEADIQSHSANLTSPVSSKREPVNADFSPTVSSNREPDLASPVSSNREPVSAVLASPVTYNREPVSADLASPVSTNGEPISADLTSPRSTNREPASADLTLPGSPSRELVNEDLTAPVSTKRVPVSADLTTPVSTSREPVSADLSSPGSPSRDPVSADLSLLGSPGREPVSADLIFPGSPGREPVSADLTWPESPSREPVSADLTLPGSSSREPVSADLTLPGSFSREPVSADLTLPGSPSSEPVSADLTLPGSPSREPVSADLTLPGFPSSEPVSADLTLPESPSREPINADLTLPGSPSREPANADLTLPASPSREQVSADLTLPESPSREQISADLTLPESPSREPVSADLTLPGSFSREPVSADLTLPGSPSREPVSADLTLPGSPSSEPVSADLTLPESPSREPINADLTLPGSFSREPVSADLTLPGSPSSEPVSADLTLPGSPSSEPVSADLTLPESPSREPVSADLTLPGSPSREPANADLTLPASPSREQVSADLTLPESPSREPANADLTLPASPSREQVSADLTLPGSPSREPVSADLTLPGSPSKEPINADFTSLVSTSREPADLTDYSVSSCKPVTENDTLDAAEVRSPKHDDSDVESHVNYEENKRTVPPPAANVSEDIEEPLKDNNFSVSQGTPSVKPIEIKPQEFYDEDLNNNSQSDKQVTECSPLADTCTEASARPVQESYDADADLSRDSLQLGQCEHRGGPEEEPPHIFDDHFDDQLGQCEQQGGPEEEPPQLFDDHFDDQMPSDFGLDIGYLSPAEEPDVQGGQYSANSPTGNQFHPLEATIEEDSHCGSEPDVFACSSKLGAQETKARKPQLSQVMSGPLGSTGTTKLKSELKASVMSTNLKNLVDKYLKREPVHEVEPDHLGSHHSSQIRMGRSQESQSALRDTPRPLLQDGLVDAQMTRSKELIARLKQILRTTQVGMNARIAQWQTEVEELEKKSELPGTTIAVVGNTGEGKSSLMNALLDHADILPTSDVRACTSVVVEISSNKKDNSYNAWIDFLSVEEWENELKLLLTALTGQDGRVRVRQPDPQTAPGVAWNKIRAVYGPFKDNVTLQQLQELDTVTHWLGRQKRIRDSSGSRFRAQIDRYIESNDSGKGGDYWPIVKKVTVQIPRCDVLSSGATLIDLPGTGDSNPARDRIAKEFLKTSTAVWVVASIHRAINNKTAKDLLGEHFRRQLMMDGQYGCVSFICTKTDVNLMPSEMIRKSELGLGPITSTLVKEISAQEKERDEKVTALQEVKEELEMLQKEENEVKTECMELDMAIKELTQTVENQAEDEDIDAPVEDLKAIQAIHVEKIDLLKTHEREKQQRQLVKTKHELEILEVDNKLANLRRELTAICAKARNDYARKAIRRDFKAGMRELQRKAGDDDEEEEEEEEYSDEEGEEDQQLNQTAENLQVFCVSATDFLKLTERMAKNNGPPTVFTEIHETGIPSLKEFIHKVTRCRRREAAERIVRDIGHLTSTILAYMFDDGTEDLDIRNQAISIFRNQHENLQQQKIESLICRTENKIDELISSDLKPKLDVGVQRAESAADSTCARWGAKQNKSCPGSGGYHHSTYMAVCRYSGVYKSAAAGDIDFNRDLSAPMYACITIVWNDIFNTRLKTILQDFGKKVLSYLVEFGEQISPVMEQLGLERERLARIIQQQKANASYRLDQTTKRLLLFIQDKQKDINRIITPLVQEEMADSYAACMSEKGTGSFARMKAHMSSHVDSKKDVMFSAAKDHLEDQLMLLQTELIQQLRDFCNELTDELTALYEPLWNTGTKTRTLRDALQQDMRQLVRSLESHYMTCGIELDSEFVVFKQLLEQCCQTNDTAPGPINTSVRSKLSLKGSPRHKGLKRDFSKVEGSPKTGSQDRTRGKKGLIYSPTIHTRPGPTSWNSPPDTTYMDSPPKRIKTTRMATMNVQIKTEEGVPSGQTGTRASSNIKPDTDTAALSTCQSHGPYHRVRPQADPSQSRRSHSLENLSVSHAVIGSGYPVCTPLTQPGTSDGSHAVIGSGYPVCTSLTQPGTSDARIWREVPKPSKRKLEIGPLTDLSSDDNEDDIPPAFETRPTKKWKKQK